MLNHAAFVLLSDRKKIPDDTLRFFLNLMCRTNIRYFRVIQIRPLFGQSRDAVARHLRILTDLGLLEVGPMLRLKTMPSPTYRLAPRYRLLKDSLYSWTAESEELMLRDEIAPVPIAFLDSLSEGQAATSNGLSCDGRTPGQPEREYPNLARGMDPIQTPSSAPCQIAEVQPSTSGSRPRGRPRTRNRTLLLV